MTETDFITGMGMVSLLGATTDEFERNLLQGRHGIVPLPKERKEGLTVQVTLPRRGGDAGNPAGLDGVPEPARAHPGR